MNSSTIKKHARDLQAITGMPYQSAHRAVVDGTEFEASVRSGLTLSDFVTPREKRIWHLVNRTGVLNCAAGRHWMSEEVLGQCVGCGTYMAQKHTYDGDTYYATIDEDEFFEQCVATAMYSNWAPPLAYLGGATQASYFSRSWTSTDEDFNEAAWDRAPSASGGLSTENVDPWALPYTADPNALTLEQVDLLRAVDELQTDGSYPSTKDVGERMFDMLKERGAPYFWSASAPWHGTNPAADQLRDAGLVDVHVGMASMRRWDQPAETPKMYWLELTEAGRAAIRARTAE